MQGPAVDAQILALTIVANSEIDGIRQSQWLAKHAVGIGYTSSKLEFDDVSW